MKRILPILIMIALLIPSISSAIADEDMPDSEIYPCAWDDGNTNPIDIETNVQITGGSGTNNNNPPIVKCKWEFDMSVVLDPDVCDPFPCTQGCPAFDCAPTSIVEPDGFWRHDACPCTPGLQVKPNLYSNANVGYFAVVTDPEGREHIDAVYADIWHPDLTFKYQIELFPITDRDLALAIWDHAWECHSDLITINDDWASGLTGFIPGTTDPITPDWDIRDELLQEEAYLYVGCEVISYCQPGGWYYVGIRAMDGYDDWSPYLFNRFWYIPTSAIAVDFVKVDYETVAESVNKWVGGDLNFEPTTSDKPTVRNIGNTPAELYVWQDDMNFQKTAGEWNVEYDVRLGATGTVRNYDPFEFDLITPPAQGGDQDDPDNWYPGIRIPGVLPICTQEKLDFSIHVYKGFPGDPYFGQMKLFTFMDMTSYIWNTPADWPFTAPQGVDQVYIGPVPP